MIWNVELPQLKEKTIIKNFPIDRDPNYVNVEAFVLTNKKFLDTLSDETRRIMILDIIQYYYNITEFDMLKKSRKREFIEPRHHYTYMLKKETDFSLSTIGKYIGNRDHATVLNSVRAWNNLLDTDSKIRSKTLEVDNLFGNKIDSVILGKEDPRDTDEEVIANWENIKHKYYLIEYSYELKKSVG